jgi:hypothetical protein
VNSEADFEELFRQILREDRALVEYFQPETKRLS